MGRKKKRSRTTRKPKSGPVMIGRQKVKTLFQHAVKAHLQGDAAQARKHYTAILDQFPNHIPSLNNMGAICMASAGQAQAMGYFQRAVDLDPQNSDALNNLGILAKAAGRLTVALECFQKASALQPADAEILANLGAVYRAAGNTEEALACLQAALDLESGNATALNNLGLVYKDRGDGALALEYVHKAYQAAGDDEEILFNLGEMLVAAGNFEDALAVAQQALDSYPQSMMSIVGAARTYVECGRWEAADPLLQAAAGCQFGLAQLPLLRHLMLFVNASVLSPEEIAGLHGQAGDLIRRYWRQNGRAPTFEWEARRRQPGRLRIGYLSPDFKRHSVGWFFREIIRHHNPERFAIHCYANSTQADEVTAEIKRKATSFRWVKKWSDTRLARQVYDDGIQILVDLAGYTRANRLDVLAIRPAPVQITAIGYPHGTGLDTVDYRLSDRRAEIASAQNQYRETLLATDGFFLPRPALARPAGGDSRKAYGIPADVPVLASFNAWHKLRPEVLQLWRRILDSVTDARLLISFQHSQSAYARSRVAAYFEAAANRVLFLSPTATEEQHRQRYRLADLALDPYPYSGTTTSWEALAMGVPVVTLKGKRHVQRTTYSLLYHLGLGHLAVDNETAYHNKVVDLLADPRQLQAWRKQVAGAVDSVRRAGNREYVVGLEKLYNQAWDAYLRKSE